MLTDGQLRRQFLVVALELISRSCEGLETNLEMLLLSAHVEFNKKKLYFRSRQSM